MAKEKQTDVASKLLGLFVQIYVRAFRAHAIAIFVRLTSNLAQIYFVQQFEQKFIEHKFKKWRPFLTIYSHLLVLYSHTRVYGVQL